MKICSKCKKTKNISQFNKGKFYKNGYNNWCKSCHKNYRKNHKKQITEAIKIWTKKHRWCIHYSKAKGRCNNPKNTAYKYYGGRGIRFLMTKENFEYLWFRDKAYLMDKPSIDRKDNNGNYTLENCRFIEIVENIGRANRGENNHFAILTKKQVKQIRKIYNKGKYSSRQLAKRFGMSKTNILDIVNYKIWKCVK